MINVHRAPNATWRKLASTVVKAAVTVTLLSAAVAGQESATPIHGTLYERLGSYDGVTAFVGLVFPRVVQHPDLAHMFRGHGNDSQRRQFQLVVDLICERTGGPCAYIGRPMRTVHDGLGISDSNWATFMKIIAEGMAEKRYAPDVRSEFLEVWRSFRDGVVQR
ncbi:MAG: group I truncated hemoglobin [Gemmatimonadaceae bacterium]